jgi:4-hydroxybenzoate polyprenyltransferase
MAKIDVVKARIDLLKTVFSSVVIGGMVSLAIIAIQTFGANLSVFAVAMASLAIIGILIAKAFKNQFDELEGL